MRLLRTFRLGGRERTEIGMNPLYSLRGISQPCMHAISRTSVDRSIYSASDSTSLITCTLSPS